MAPWIPEENLLFQQFVPCCIITCMAYLVSHFMYGITFIAGYRVLLFNLLTLGIMEAYSGTFERYNHWQV
jgi:hypothetical protein